MLTTTPRIRVRIPTKPVVFLKNGPFPTFFLYFRLSIQFALNKCSITNLLMPRFELPTSSVGINSSAICATSAAIVNISVFKRAIHSLFFIHYQSFQTNKRIWHQIKIKNAHPVSGAGIRTHVLLNMSLLPLPLDQGSSPYWFFVKYFVIIRHCTLNKHSFYARGYKQI